MSIIRGSALAHLDDFIAELGGDGPQFADRAGLRHADIGRHDRFIPLHAGLRLLEDAAHRLEAPDFGRQLAKRQSIEILGPVGLAGRSSATVGDAFAQFDTYMAAYSPGIRAHIRADPNPLICRFEFEYLLDPAPPQAQAIELSLGVTLQVLREFLGKRYRPLSVQIPHDALTPAADYRRYFGAPAEFNRPVGGFTLPADDLNRPLSADRLAHQTAIDYLTEYLSDHDQTLSGIVRVLVRQFLAVGPMTLPSLADQLGMHPKALQRRLDREGTPFGALVDCTRRDIARNLLRNTDLGMDQLSHQLGYAEQSVLTRSCRRWFEMTPTEYRRHCRESSG